MDTTSEVIDPSELALAGFGRHIARSPETCGGRPRIAGSRIRVQDIYVWHELQGRSVDEIIAAFPQLDRARVHSALAYYFTFCDSIQADMDADERRLEELMKSTGPGPLADQHARRKAHGENDQIPPR